MRLNCPARCVSTKRRYIAVQSIYYPGFTYGGFGEGLGTLATLILLFAMPANRPAFWCTLTAFVALVAMQVAYWVITHPVNKFWLKDTQLKGVAGGFFSLNPMKSGAASEDGIDGWKKLRDRWEYSHVLRAVLSIVALIALIVAIAI